MFQVEKIGNYNNPEIRANGNENLGFLEYNEQKEQILGETKKLLNTEAIINEVKNNSIVKAYYSLNPTLAPKI